MGLENQALVLKTLVLATLTQATAELPLERGEGAERPSQEASVGAQPHLRFDREVWCVELPRGSALSTPSVSEGAYRLQCDEQGEVCLLAPDRVLKDGAATEQPLERTSLCTPLSTPDFERVTQGRRVIAAVAEAPDGWFRDDSGRIMQVNFDLHRRVYFGGSYAPLFRPGPANDLSAATLHAARGRADFGIEIELATHQERELHRLHILEGSAWLGGDHTRFLGTALRYDWSARRLSPPLWISTFVGRPRRVDLDVNLSGWFEALRLEFIANQTFLTLLSANASIDLWHSTDLQSYFRLRLGPAGEFEAATRSVSLRPEAALEGDFTLDRDGFHHLTLAVVGEKLFFEQPLEGRRRSPQRLRARAGYELILLAINDYPLTLVVEARALWRDDLPQVIPGWDFGLDAGLRMNFWAPQRRTALPVLKRG